MVPNKDYYADKNGKLTDDPEKFALQIAVAGVLLDDRIAKRYGIEDSLVSVDEPAAPRRVMQQRNEASMKIVRAEDKAEEKSKKPQEPAAAEEPKAEKPNAEAKKPAAKKGEKKK